MKNLFTLLLLGFSFCALAESTSSNVTIPAPISFTNCLQLPDVQTIDSQVLSQMAVQFNGKNNPQVLLVEDNAIIRYYDGNTSCDWKVLHSGTGWNGALQKGGGGTTKVVAQMAAQFNANGNPYIVVGEWGGFIDFYNGTSWQVISDRSWDYANVSAMWVQFNGANYPSVVAGFGEGDGDINFYNGNSGFTWTKLNPNPDYFGYSMNYTVKQLFVGTNGSDTPSIITLMTPVDPMSPIFLYYYGNSTNTWHDLVTSSYMDYHVAQVSAQFDGSNYYILLSVLPTYNTNPGRIVFFNGSKWTTLLQTTDVLSGKFSAKFNGSANPYIVSTTADSKVQFFNGSTWINIPDPQLNITKLYDQFNGTNNPYIVVGDNSNQIKFFDGQKWVVLSGADKALTENLVSGKSSIMRVEFNGDKNPCLVVGDIQNDIVFFYNGSNWIPLLDSKTLENEHKAAAKEENEEYESAVQAEQAQPGGNSGWRDSNWNGN